MEESASIKSKRATTRARGRGFEFWVRDWLIESGWDVHLCGRKAKMIRDKRLGIMKMVLVGDDIFGCDGVAVKPGEKTLFFQATLHSGKGEKLKQVSGPYWDPAHQDVQLWMKRANGDVEVSRLDGDFQFEGKTIVCWTTFGLIRWRKFYSREASNPAGGISPEKSLQGGPK